MLKIKVLKEQQSTAAPTTASAKAPAAAPAAAPVDAGKELENQKAEFVKILNGTIQALQQISQGMSKPTPAATPAAAAPKQPAAAAPAPAAAPAKAAPPKA